MQDLRSRYGQYAIVTGASSGIGAEFARQLAAAGVDAVLVARRRDRLEALAEELTRVHGTRNQVVALDLRAEGAINELWQRVAHLDVGILVANAGTWVAGPFLDHALSDEVDVLTLDAAVPMQLAHRFGSDFVVRGRGGIVLVASVVGAIPVPYQANYGAAKAYVLSLGQALHHELKEKGVDVLVVSPGVTRTEGTAKGAGIDFSRMGAAMAPSRVAEVALQRLGTRPHVVPGLINALGDVASRYLLPRSLTTRIYGAFVRRALTHEVRVPS